MMRNEDDTPGNDEELLPRLFRALGPRVPLPDDMRRGWEAAFSRELSNRNARRRRRRRRQLVAACAGLAALWIALIHVPRDAPLAPAMARVAMVVGDVEATTADTNERLHDGGEVRAGQTLRVGRHAYLALRLRGTDVRLNSGAVLTLQPARVRLDRGDLYVDAPSTSNTEPPLVIETALGTLTHLGTQFIVSMDADAMQMAVREGSVAINAAGERRTISASDGPTELVVSHGTLTARPIAATGGIWSWVVDAAPGFAIDGRSADELLVWAARQLGAELSYATEATHNHARTVVLHGGTRELSVAQGLAILASTTDLAVDRSDPAVLHVRARLR